MSLSQHELNEALQKLRHALQTHPVRTSVIGTGIGADPSGSDSAEGIVILHDVAAPPTTLQAIRDLAHETAPAAAVHLLPSARPSLQGARPQ